MNSININNQNLHFQKKEYKDTPRPSPKQLRIDKVYSNIKKMDSIKEEQPAGWPNIHFGD